MTLADPGNDGFPINRCFQGSSGGGEKRPIATQSGDAALPTQDLKRGCFRDDANLSFATLSRCNPPCRLLVNAILFATLGGWQPERPGNAPFRRFRHAIEKVLFRGTFYQVGWLNVPTGTFQGDILAVYGLKTGQKRLFGGFRRSNTAHLVGWGPCPRIFDAFFSRPRQGPPALGRLGT